MSRDRFRGYYHQQFNHQRLDLGLVGMPGIEKGVLLDLTVLFGVSRQQFGLNDGSLSFSGSAAKVDEVARWLAHRTPGLSVARAEKALFSLSKEFGQIEISRAGVVKMRLLAGEQKDAPSEEAGRKRASRKNQRMEKALLCLSKVNGEVLEADAVLYRIMGALRCKARTAEGVLKDLAGEGVVVPADGGLLVCVPKLAPSALAPPVSERPSDGESPAGAVLCEGDGDVTCAHPPGVTCHNHYIISDHKRGSKEPHDHDARAGASDEGNPPKPAGAGPGPGFHEGGGERMPPQAAGRESLNAAGSRSGIDAIYQCHWRNLGPTAVRLLGSSSPEKSRSILESKIRGLCDYCGPERGQEIFRELVHAIHTEMNCPGGQRLREPCMELSARVNEAMGLPRRQGRGAGSREQRAEAGGRR